MGRSARLRCLCAALLRGACLTSVTVIALAACSLPMENPVAPAIMGGGPATPAPSAEPPATRRPVTVGADPAVPLAAQDLLSGLLSGCSPGLVWVPDAQAADIRLIVEGAGEEGPRRSGAGEMGSARSQALAAGVWTYAMAAPLRTTEDGVASAEVLSTWRGEPAGPFRERPLFVSGDTLRTLRAAWGAPAATVRAVSAAALLDEAERAGGWAILPFEELDVRWKVLRVDGASLLEKAAEGAPAAAYPLQVRLGLAGAQCAGALAPLPVGPGMLTNRDGSRMTIVAMTGTTALTRSTAYTMMARGATYPARDIGSWLAGADLTHISSEAPFTPNCPVPPDQNTMVFCAQEGNIELLEAIGTDIVELTGNHLLDYGPEAFRHTLEIFRARGWRWYGGGENLEEARRPLLVSHGPNRLAFIGRNPAGPPSDWAGEDSPGTAPCDYEELRAQIQRVCAEGYLPIVTLQYQEAYEYAPSLQQVADFRSLVEVGAVVVQGSQAHQPQGLEVYGGSFIHYGLGNLFFDQMQSLGTRQEFVDRLVFYDGRLLSVDLRTALLEEYARPRPMTAEERAEFLRMIFDVRP